jgi:hypothetical protein
MTAETPETDDRSDSSSMGRRYLTPIVTALVLAITVGSLLAGGGVRDFLPLRISVSPRIENGPAIGAALRELLAIETGRSVRLAEQFGDDCDVYLMPHSEFVDMIEKKRSLADVGLMITSDDDGPPPPGGIVIASPSGQADYLAGVLFRSGVWMASPGPGERARAAVDRLEAAGVSRVRRAGGIP